MNTKMIDRRASGAALWCRFLLAAGLLAVSVAAPAWAFGQRAADGGTGDGEREVVERPAVVSAMVARRRALVRQIGEHMRLTVLVMGLAIGVGVTVGIALTRYQRMATGVLGVASVIQTVPSLALLALMIPLLGIGVAPAVTALFLYALLPIMRNTYTAIQEVDDTMIEVGKGMGMTNMQILWRVEVPLCVSVVMAGIRTSTVICVGIATLCTFIGAGGLGTSIMEGMQNRGSTLILVGVIPAIALALILDGLMAGLQKLLTPKGLKIET